MTPIARPVPVPAAAPAAAAGTAGATHAPLAGTQLPGTTGSLLRTFVALIIVLAVVLAVAALMRRLRVAGSGARGGGLELLAQMPLGPRERAVLLRVGARQLLLGVAPGHVCTLHVLDAAETAATGSPGTRAGQQKPGASGLPSFRALLRKSLGF